MLSPLANIFTCKSWISAENKAVFSETEVVFIRGSLTQTLSLCVTLSLFLYLPVLFHSRCQNYPRNWEGKRKKKHKLDEKMKRLAETARSDTVRPPPLHQGCWEFRQAANSPHKHLSGRGVCVCPNTVNCGEELRCQSWRWVTADNRASSSITSEHKQTTGVKRQEKAWGGRDNHFKLLCHRTLK